MLMGSKTPQHVREEDRFPKAGEIVVRQSWTAVTAEQRAARKIRCDLSLTNDFPAFEGKKNKMEARLRQTCLMTPFPFPIVVLLRCFQPRIPYDPTLETSLYLFRGKRVPGSRPHR